MVELELTRWATYLLPGSVVLLGICLLYADVAGYDVFRGLYSIEKRRSLIVIVFAFSAASYIVGIGLWGICYSPPVQRTLFSQPDEKRVHYARKFLREPCRQEKYYHTLKRYFPQLPQSKKDPNNFEYADFQFIILAIYEDASDVTKDRIIWERDTIGLLQSLILSCIFLCVVFLVSATARVPHMDWPIATKFYIACGLTFCVVMALYTHYFERNYYLVRDVIMAFLSINP